MSEGSTPIHVLHVDDDSAVLDLTRAFLERERSRLTVESVDCPTVAFDRLEESGGVDCVLSDYRMPEMDGLAFLKRIRDRRPSLPFLLYSTGNREKLAPDAFAAGADGFVRKQSDAEHFRQLGARIVDAVEDRNESVSATAMVPAASEDD